MADRTWPWGEFPDGAPDLFRLQRYARNPLDLMIAPKIEWPRFASILSGAVPPDDLAPKRSETSAAALKTGIADG